MAKLALRTVWSRGMGAELAVMLQCRWRWEGKMLKYYGRWLFVEALTERGQLRNHVMLFVEAKVFI